MMRNTVVLALASILLCWMAVPAAGQSIQWVSLEEAQKKAADTNKKVFIYAEAQWCGYCKKMEAKVFPQKSVQDSLHKYFYPVRIDIESTDKVKFGDRSYSEQMLARKFRVQATPTMIFLNSGGEVMGTQPGFIPADIFDKLLGYVGTELFNELPFEEYLKREGVSLQK